MAAQTNSPVLPIHKSIQPLCTAVNMIYMKDSFLFLYIKWGNSRENNLKKMEKHCSHERRPDKSIKRCKKHAFQMTWAHEFEKTTRCQLVYTWQLLRTSYITLPFPSINVSNHYSKLQLHLYQQNWMRAGITFLSLHITVRTQTWAKGPDRAPISREGKGVSTATDHLSNPRDVSHQCWDVTAGVVPVTCRQTQTKAKFTKIQLLIQNYG